MTSISSIRKATILPIEQEINQFKYGTIDFIEEQNIPPGSASKSSNFKTRGDKIELAGGNFNLGGTIDGDQSSSLGGHVGIRRDKTEFLFKKRGRKLEVYDSEADIWNECGSDIFPEAAIDDEMTAVNYDSQAGSQIFISSENSSIYKIMTANPTDIIDMVSTDYRGKIFLSQNRIFLIQRKGSNLSKDDTSVYPSYIDENNYTDITAESVGTGDGSTKAFTGTLTFKSGHVKRTCFGITISDSTEIFTDDYNGNLTGSLGGTGTINYATGAFSVTFNTAPTNLQAITSDYLWEDSTNHGVIDFTFSSPRIAGQGDVFPQVSGGGKAQAVVSFKDHEFCFHERKTWDLVLSSDDTNATNLPYRDNVGISNWRAAASDGTGIFFIDDSKLTRPVLRQLTLAPASTEIIPIEISTRKDLSGYLFDKAWMKINDNFVIWAGRSINSTKNDTLFIYDKVWKSIDSFPQFSSWGVIYQGSLVLGDSLSPNVYVSFSGYDDNGAQVSGSWESNLWNMGFKQLKKCKEVWIEGEIQKNQIILVSASSDHGSYVPVGYIRGDGTYVDSVAVTLGSSSMGRMTIGGRTDGIITAFHYLRPLKLNLDKFLELKLKFEVSTDESDSSIEGLGYFSVSSIKYHDIRIKQKKLPTKYRVAN